MQHPRLQYYIIDQSSTIAEKGFVLAILFGSVQSSPIPSGPTAKRTLSVVRSIGYVMVCARTNLANAVSVVSIFMSKPGKAPWEAVRWIMRYLKRMSNICLVDGANTQSDLVGCAD
ncbi:hypothetical protein LXL04_032146 [Taraxacum kok-saghyz]